MTMRNVAFVLAAASLLISARAEPTYYDGSVNFLEVIPAPPAASTPAGAADLDTVLQVQFQRSQDEIRRAQRVARQTPFSFGRPVLGDWFREENLPKTKAIFDQIGRQTGPICDKAKAYWNRPRPYIYDARVLPVVDRPGNSSYPSGHAYGSSIWGIILAAAFPDKAAEINQQIYESMWGRVLGGAHYPSDTEAALILARAVGKKLLKSPDTQRSLETMRAEMAPFLNK